LHCNMHLFCYAGYSAPLNTKPLEVPSYFILSHFMHLKAQVYTTR